VSNIPTDPVGTFDLLELIADSPQFDNNSVYLKPTVDLDDHSGELHAHLTDYNEQFDYDRITTTSNSTTTGFTNLSGTTTCHLMLSSPPKARCR